MDVTTKTDAALLEIASNKRLFEEEWQAAIDELKRRLARAKWTPPHVAEVADMVMKEVGEGVPMPDVCDLDGNAVEMSWKKSDLVRLTLHIKDGSVGYSQAWGVSSLQTAPGHRITIASAAQIVRDFYGVANPRQALADDIRGFNKAK